MLRSVQPIRVFLVDDHRTILWGLERLVESAAPRMTVAGTASTCAELFARLPEAKPDVILLDVDLAGASSLDCLDALCRESKAHVLLFTGSHDTALHQQALLHGARGVVHKEASADACCARSTRSTRASCGSTAPRSAA